ncbi:MAG: antibiotic biosynthesis monooxygenase [Rhodobacteraceae bacterium]|nr:antibiotic biosynthesis monooxygenase [Paracoccaceae bacterium]
MIHVTGTLTCATEVEAEIVRRCLPTHIALSRAEPGCLTFNVDPTEDPLVWRLDETFTDRAAFEAHQARTRASEWFTATNGLARDFKVTEG